MGERMNTLMQRWMKGWMNELKDESMNEWWKNESMNA